MVELIEQFNLERSAADKPAIRIGIGIATGDVVAGYTGTQQRATYTCIGDTVNLAARLEAHTKVAGRGILIDEATQRALGRQCADGVIGRGAVQGQGRCRRNFLGDGRPATRTNLIFETNWARLFKPTHCCKMR